MSFETRQALSDLQVSANMRRAADLVEQAAILLQSTFEDDEERYDELCIVLSCIGADLEMEADELDSLLENG